MGEGMRVPATGRRGDVPQQGTGRPRIAVWGEMASSTGAVERVGRFSVLLHATVTHGLRGRWNVSFREDIPGWRIGIGERLHRCRAGLKGNRRRYAGAVIGGGDCVASSPERGGAGLAVSGDADRDRVTAEVRNGSQLTGVIISVVTVLVAAQLAVAGSG